PTRRSSDLRNIIYFDKRRSSLMVMPINTLILVLVIGIMTYLQLKFSRSDSKIPGLILPGITFLYSLLGAAGFASFQSFKSPQIEVNGKIVQEAVHIENWGQVILSFILIMIWLNI